MDADKYYDSFYEKNPLKKFAAERRENMESYKVNKTELKDADWGSIDKAKMRDKIMKSSNKNSLVKDVYAIVESGWEDAPSEKLKYPLMGLFGDTFYYVRGALSSALAYAKQNNESAVVTKVESLYKKFKLEDDNKKEGKDKKMDDNKEFEIEGRIS